MYACTHVVIARRALTLKYYTGSCLCLATVRFIDSLSDYTALPPRPHRTPALRTVPSPGLPPSRAATSGPPSEPRCRLRACLPPSRAATSGPPSEPRCRLRACLPPSRAATSGPPSEPRCRLRACLPPSRAAVSGPPSEPRCRPRASLRAALPSPGLPQSRAAAFSPPSRVALPPARPPRTP